MQGHAEPKILQRVDVIWPGLVLTEEQYEALSTYMP